MISTNCRMSSFFFSPLSKKSGHQQMTAPIFLSVVTSSAAPGRMESSRTHLTQPSSWGFAANVHVLGRQETGKRELYQKVAHSCTGRAPGMTQMSCWGWWCRHLYLVGSGKWERGRLEFASFRTDRKSASKPEFLCFPVLLPGLEPRPCIPCWGGLPSHWEPPRRAWLGQGREGGTRGPLGPGRGSAGGFGLAEQGLAKAHC